MREDKWVEKLVDKDYINTFKHPDIIKCKECIYKCINGRCSNMRFYPIVPKNFGCKNGILKRDKKEETKYNVFQKIKCKLGFHQEIWLGKSNPFFQEILMKCDCCGKYGLWKTGTNQTIWFKDEEKHIYLNESCIEMIKKYNL